MKLKFNLEKILLFLFSVSIFCNGYMVYTWNTYTGPLGPVASILQVFGCLLLPIVLILKQPKLMVKPKSLLLFFAAIILQIHISCMGAEKKGSLSISVITLFVDLFCILLLTKEQRSQIHKFALYFFALACLPSLIYFLMDLVGISIPAEVLQSNQPAKIRNGVYYLHAPFGLLIHQNGAGFMYRMCGIFDEAGFVGSVAAFFIASGYKRVDKKWIYLLLAEGIFSLSMAFYLLLAIFIIARSFTKGATKFAAVMLVLLVGFSIFMNVEFENEYINRLKSRIDFTSVYLVKDNRTSDKFDSKYADLLSENTYEKFMGYGYNAVASDPMINASYSYKCLIYDYGLVGFALYVIFFLYAASCIGINKKSFPLLAVFFASMYQRPYMFTAMYLVLYLSALELVQTEETIDKVFFSLGKRNSVNREEN